MILNQLLYSGVLETVRIRRMGYPYRETWKDFWNMCKDEMFDHCVDPPIDPKSHVKEACKQLLSCAFPPDTETKVQEINVLVFSISDIFL